MKQYQTIEFDQTDVIANIRLNRTEVHNAFNDIMIAELTDCFIRIEKLEDIRLVILQGNGKSFCAGADLHYMKGIAKFGYKENYEDAQKLAKLFETVYNCTKPTLAVVHGACFGGANGLIAACDIVIAEESTKFAFSEVKLGIAPATIGPFVLKKTGEFNGRDLMMTGRRFSGKEAERVGLVNRAVGAGEMEEVLENYIKEFISAAPGAVRATKEMIVKVVNEGGPGITEYTADLIAGLRASDEGQEGMAAFLEKRAPNWKKE
jgi:methylglutaconyl-CoA hydratase